MKVIIRDLYKDHRPIYDMIQKRTLEQGNKFDDSFEVKKSSGGYGFCWSDTVEGYVFWDEIDHGNFDVFYEKYPRTSEKFSDKYKFKIGEKVKCRGISEEVTIYAYRKEKSSYLLTGRKGGHDGREYDLYDDNGNIIEQPPYDGSSFWFADDSDLTKVSSKTSSEPVIDCDVEVGSLPEKWCIKVTEENMTTLAKWRDAGSLGDTRGYVRYRGGRYNAKGYWQGDFPSDCVEITFDQFKKWVLGKEEVIEEKMDEHWKPKVHDWVVITKSSKNFNISMESFVGKCVQITSLYYPSIRFDNDGGWQWNYDEGHFRKALPHEIPTISLDTTQLKEEPKKSETREELTQRIFIEKGFDKIKKGDIYVTISGNQYKASRDASVSSNGYFIDCGSGFLWNSSEPDKFGYKLEKTDSLTFHNEQLLAEARRRYPVGTKFICPFTRCKDIVTSDKFDNLKVTSDGYVDADGMYYLYHRNIWAEIIESVAESIPELKLPVEGRIAHVVSGGNPWSTRYWEQIQHKHPYFGEIDIESSSPSPDFTWLLQGLPDKTTKTKSKSQLQLKMIPVRKIKVRNNQNN